MNGKTKNISLTSMKPTQTEQKEASIKKAKRSAM